MVELQNKNVKTQLKLHLVRKMTGGHHILPAGHAVDFYCEFTVACLGNLTFLFPIG